MRYMVELQPRGFKIEVQPGETILEAAIRQQYALPHSCDNGVCEICSARLLAGHCRLRNSQRAIKTGNEGADNLLLCLAKPEVDCTLEIHNILAPGELPLRRLACQVSQIELLRADVYRVRLLAPAGKKLEYHGGQYLQLLIPGLDSAYFSIANAPGSRELELHVEVPPERENAAQVLQFLKQSSTVRVELPFGKACVTGKVDGPVLLIAAGTGFAQIKSIAESLLAQGFDKPMHIYWGTRTLNEMYMKDLPEQWQQQHANVFFVPIAADNADNAWQGHHDELCLAVKSRHAELSESYLFVSGSPTMVYTLQDCLASKGLTPHRVYSDVFEYAPRP
jgi:CDP-4-dehydro-6-deoxyglucose reductase, E3